MNEVYIVTPNGTCHITDVTSNFEYQFMGNTEDGGVVVFTKFGDLPDSAVTVLYINDESSTAYRGNNQNTMVFDNADDAERAQTQLNSIITFIKACQKVKEEREGTDE